MNPVRKKVIEFADCNSYLDFNKHKDLIAFTLGESYLCYDEETGKELEPDFNEMIVVVEKDWLFKLMMEDGIENPRKYLQEEYTFDDSYSWFIEGALKHKIVTVDFV